MPLFYLPIVIYAGLVELWLDELQSVSSRCAKPVIAQGAARILKDSGRTLLAPCGELEKQSRSSDGASNASGRF